MTILLTGATGKVGVPLTRLLSANTSYEVMVASRKGVVPTTISTNPIENVHGIAFDWLDRSSWTNPFSYVEANSLSSIDRIFLIGPQVWDLRFMKDFIDLAKQKGVKRFVLLASTQAGNHGDNSFSPIIKHLKELTDLEYGILRPTWFTENFGENLLQMIRDQNAVYSLCEDGKIPFVSAEDIAEAGFKALTDEPNSEWIVHGPELLTYDQATSILSSVLGRTITHVRITKESYIAHFEELGFPQIGRGLAEIELRTAKGSEEFIFKHEKAWVGKVTLKEYFEKNKDLWIQNSG